MKQLIDDVCILNNVELKNAETLKIHFNHLIILLLIIENTLAFDLKLIDFNFIQKILKEKKNYVLILDIIDSNLKKKDDSKYFHFSHQLFKLDYLFSYYKYFCKDDEKNQLFEYYEYQIGKKIKYFYDNHKKRIMISLSNNKYIGALNSFNDLIYNLSGIYFEKEQRSNTLFNQ